MWDWLASPIDADRVHDVSFVVAYHGRVMFLAWGVLAPFAVIIARFFKILPGQDWPLELDNRLWWRSHWIGHSLVCVLSVGGLILVMPPDFDEMHLHSFLGYGVLVALLAQIALGIFRGSKGGPTALARDGSPRGHHYDMTARRRRFELLHKSLGYTVLLLAVVTIVLGMWKANAPNWMWIIIGTWWTMLTFAFYALQRRGMAVDTYQAIWGADPAHPGNQLPSAGWGMRRPSDAMKGESNVRSDRGDRVRGH